MDAEALITRYHGAALRSLCSALDTHYNGLGVAARAARKRGRINGTLCKRLVQLDDAFSVTQHITSVKGAVLLQSLEDVLAAAGATGVAAAAPAPPAEPPSSTTSTSAQPAVHVEGVVEDEPASPVPTEDADTEVEENPKNDRPEKVKLEKDKLEKEKLRDKAKQEIDQLFDPYLQQVASMRSLMERLPRAERVEKEDEVNELEANLRTFAKRAFSDITQSLGLCDHSSDHLHQHISMKLAGINKRGMPVQHSKSKLRKKKGL